MCTQISLKNYQLQQNIFNLDVIKNYNHSHFDYIKKSIHFFLSCSTHLIYSLNIITKIFEIYHISTIWTKITGKWWLMTLTRWGFNLNVLKILELKFSSHACSRLCLLLFSKLINSFAKLYPQVLPWYIFFFFFSQGTSRFQNSTDVNDLIKSFLEKL